MVNRACKQEVFSGFLLVLFVLLSVQHNGVHLVGFLWHWYESDLSLAHSEHHGCGMQVMIRPQSPAPSPQRLCPLRRPRAYKRRHRLPVETDTVADGNSPLCVAAQRLRPLTSCLRQMAARRLSGYRTFSSFQGVAFVSSFHNNSPLVEGGVRGGQRSANPEPSLHL